MDKFGSWSEELHQILHCDQCHYSFLPIASFDYNKDEYRNAVDGDATVIAYHHNHDSEQTTRLEVLGAGDLRGRIIADVGCGAGSFLDMVGGMADETIAIEPTRSYHERLRRHHRTYSNCSDALSDYEGKIDLAVSFAVIEHVNLPLSFLKEIRKLLKAGEKLLISTPNADDWLIDFLPGVYDRFFYRRAHRWYFSGQALKWLGKMAGVSRIEIQYRQNYDISNALHWIKEGRPTGMAKTKMFQNLDPAFRSHLEGKGISDFIYAFMTL